VFSCTESDTVISFDIAYITSNRSGIGFLNEDGILGSEIMLPGGLQVNTSGMNMLAWSPDGKKLAFNVLSGNSEIYIVDADGTNLTNITNNSSRDESPAWSPDGHRLAFTSLRDGTRNIYFYDFASHTTTRVTSTTAFYESPSWSADGTKIAFIEAVSAAEGTEIKSIDVNTGAITTVTSFPGFFEFQYLKWHPGPKFAYSYYGIGADVYSYSLDGVQQNLTNTSSIREQQASWMTSNRILYMKGDDLFKMDLDGSSKTLIHDFDHVMLNPVMRLVSFNGPDLIVADIEHSLIATDTEASFEIRITIKNIGNTVCPPSEAYVNGINPSPPTGVNSIRIQRSISVPQLEAGNEADVIVSLSMREIHAKEVNQIEVIADPKDKIQELNEVNNTRSELLDYF